MDTAAVRWKVERLQGLGSEQAEGLQKGTEQCSALHTETKSGNSRESMDYKFLWVFCTHKL